MNIGIIGCGYVGLSNVAVYSYVVEFRKRLGDYRRESNSARKHLSGRTINEYLDEITTYILVVGDTEETVLEI